MNEDGTCQSCGMTIDEGSYCQYCTDEHGKLQDFQERLERMEQWLRRQESAVSPDAARHRALAAMAEMPAWRDHPQLKALLE